MRPHSKVVHMMMWKGMVQGSSFATVEGRAFAVPARV